MAYEFFMAELQKMSIFIGIRFCFVRFRTGYPRTEMDLIGSERTAEPSTRGENPHNITPLVVRPRTAWKMLGCGNTRGYELLAAGELDSFSDGRSRKITVASIHRYIERRLEAERRRKIT
jgi:hypothetical protein